MTDREKRLLVTIATAGLLQSVVFGKSLNQGMDGSEVGVSPALDERISLAATIGKRIVQEVHKQTDTT